MNYHLLISVTILTLQSAQCDPATPKLAEVFSFYKERVKPIMDFTAFSLKNNLPLDIDIRVYDVNSTAYKLTDEQAEGFFDSLVSADMTIQYNALMLDRTTLKANNEVTDQNKTIEQLQKLSEKIAPSILPALDELKQFKTSEDCLNAISTQIESLQITVAYAKTATYFSASFYIDFCLKQGQKKD